MTMFMCNNDDKSIHFTALMGLRVFRWGKTGTYYQVDVHMVNPLTRKYIGWEWREAEDVITSKRGPFGILAPKEEYNLKLRFEKLEYGMCTRKTEPRKLLLKVCLIPLGYALPVESYLWGDLLCESITVRFNPHFQQPYVTSRGLGDTVNQFLKRRMLLELLADEFYQRRNQLDKITKLKINDEISLSNWKILAETKNSWGHLWFDILTVIIAPLVALLHIATSIVDFVKELREEPNPEPATVSDPDTGGIETPVVVGRHYREPLRAPKIAPFPGSSTVLTRGSAQSTTTEPSNHHEEDRSDWSSPHQFIR